MPATAGTRGNSAPAPFIVESAVLEQEIRDRIIEAVRKSGRSMSAISRECGQGKNWLEQMINTGREPGAILFAKLCQVLGTTHGAIIFGADVTAEEEEIARQIVDLTPERRELVRAMVRNLQNSDG